MNSRHIKKNEQQHIETYKRIMNGIEFMQPFLEDSEIFNPDSPKFRCFLIQSFAHLNSEFHYLSFVNNESIDQELVKVSGIFQILPMNFIVKNTKLFDKMSDSDIHKFWVRFFSLFNVKKTGESCADSMFSLDWENKFEFLKDMNSTLNYLNYNFPVMNSKKLNVMDLNKEIRGWSEEVNASDIIDSNSNVNISDIEEVDILSVEKLIMDIKQAVSMYGNLNHVSEEVESVFCEFFVEFSQLAKNILQFKKDFSVVESSFLDDLYCKMQNKGEFDLAENLYFINRCNNLIKTLKSRVKALEAV